MKKFLRIALVFALAGAALLYTGCTKDYEDDIARIEETIRQNQSNTDNDIDAIERRIGELENQISDLETARTNIENAISRLESASADYSDRIGALERARTTIENAISEFRTAIGTIQSTLQDIPTTYATKQELQNAKTELERQIGELRQEIADTYATQQALSDAVDNLQDAIDALEGALGLVASRIQSISFVPEYNDGKATLTRYAFGEDATYVFVGTFEVRPASAVEKVVADNSVLRVVPVEDASTRAAGQGSEVEITIDSYSYGKGYVTVRAAFGAPEDFVIGRRPPIVIRDDAEYAISLLVDQDADSDYETEIESPYVITAAAEEIVTLADNVYFTKDGDKIETDEVRIARKLIDYTDSLSYMGDNKYLAFEGYGYGVTIEGRDYTLPEAEEFLGLEEGTLDPTYRDFADYYRRPGGRPVQTHPYVLAETGVDRSLQLRSVPDMGLYRFIDYYTRYGSDRIYVAGDRTYLSLVASAIITKHQINVDVAGGTRVPWDYKHYDATDYTATLAVTAEDNNTFASFESREHVIYKKGDASQTPVAGDVVFTADGTDNVKAQIVGVPYSDEDVEYVYEGQFESATELYLVNLEFTVLARHEDVEVSVDLGEVKGNAHSDSAFPAELISAAIPESDAHAYYGEDPTNLGTYSLPAADCSTAKLYPAFASFAAQMPAEVVSVKVDGEEIDDIEPYSVTIAWGQDSDASTVNIASGEFLYGASYEIVAEYVAFDVTYTYTITFTTAATPYGLEIIPGTFVDVNVITITARNLNGVYTINDCDLRQYIQAYKSDADVEFDDEDLMVKFECTDEITDEIYPIIPDDMGLTANVAPADISKAKLTDPSRVVWNTFNKLEMKYVKCTLYVASTEQVLDTLELILKVTPDPIVTFEAPEFTINRTNNAANLPMPSSIWDGYTIIGCLSTANLAAPVGVDNDMTYDEEEGWDLNRPSGFRPRGIWVRGAIDYTQVVTIAPVTEWIVTDGLGTSTRFVDNYTNLAINPASGVITLLADQANLNGGSLTVVIPTTLTYQFGELTDNIIVKFVQQ